MPITTNGQIGGNWWEGLDKLQVRLYDLEMKLKTYQGLNDEEIRRLYEESNSIRQQIQTLSNNMSIEIGKKANVIQEAWITPTLMNEWVNYDESTYSKCQYYKDSLGIVHLKGMIKGGNAAFIFSLPSGYRPTETMIFNQPMGVDNRVNIFVVKNAGVQISASSFTGAYYSLDGITFRV